MTPREVAHDVVRRVFDDGAYADRAFRSAAAGLEARERGFAMQLAFGTVQRVRPLDHAIETLGRRPVRKLDPPVRAALRLGTYQLSMTDVKAFLSTPEKPVSIAEFREFWSSCSREEKDEFMSQIPDTTTG